MPDFNDESSKQLIETAFDPGCEPEQRREFIKLALPEQQKAEKIENAEVNRLGEHVRYYRLVGPKEAEMLLLGETVTPLTSPTLKDNYDENYEHVLHQVKSLIQNLDQNSKPHVEEAFEKLGQEPTLEVFSRFCLGSIPRFELFKLHVKQDTKVNNYFGLLSLSAGIPFLDPSGFKTTEDGRLIGSAVAEFVIPNEDVYIHPPSGGLRETEKEVNVLQLKPEWLVDIYTTPEDFAERFIANPSGPLRSSYEELIKTEPNAWVPYRAHNMIMDYKSSHRLEDLIPVSKITETDPSNPILIKPILNT